MTLEKANNILISRNGLLFTHYRFYITNKRFFRYSKEEYFEVARLLDEHGAAKIGAEKGRILWWTEDGFYWTER